MKKLSLLFMWVLTVSLTAIAGSIASSNSLEILVDELGQYKEYKIIDVRTEEEYRGDGHIKGSELVTLGNDLDQFLKQTSKDTKIIFVCRSGRRSEKAAEQAISLGFKNVKSLRGGMQAYNSLN